ADIATDLLASGHASRFYRRLLIGSDMFTGIDASISGSEDAGYLMLHAKLRNGTDITRATDTILSEALKIADVNDIRPDEMERLANRHESESTFANMEYLNRAQTIAMAELHGEDINTANERYRAVTAAAVAETVRNVIVPERCNTLVYRAESQ
ncbi:MAG: insulinase family protein, partial [Muribaculaceae bacterium]|nr:insulinase family protein [Muribaculaceae bacterium]